jgi:sugar lactone lactonase YvrE
MNMFRECFVLSLLSGIANTCWMPLAFGQMHYPLAIVGTEQGAVYVADRKLPGIWNITDGKAEIYFQGSNKFRTPLNAVRCLALDSKGRLLAGDSATREVYRFDEAGKPQPLTNGKIGIPMAIAVNKQGDLFVADLETQRIWQVPSEGGEPKEFAVIAGVRGLAFDSKGQLVAVTNLANPVQRFSPDGKPEVLVKDRPFQFPQQVAVGDEDVLYIADNYASAIWKVAPGSPPVKFVEGKPLVKPVGVAWQGKSLLVADPHAQQVFRIDADAKAKPLVEQTK